MGGLFVLAGCLMIWFALTATPHLGTSVGSTRADALIGLPFAALGLLLSWKAWRAVVIRFERSGPLLTIVWHHGERILREEMIPLGALRHVTLETALRGRASNDVYRVVIGTSSKGDIRLSDDFSAGQAFYERQRDEIRTFLGVPILDTHLRPNDS
jgi:hypothetical protein